MATWHNHSGIFDQKRTVGVRLTWGLSRGGALHCFCPRAPKTLVTPLVLGHPSLCAAEINGDKLLPHAWGSVFWRCLRLFCLCINYLGIEPLNGFALNSHGRRVWSLARTSFKVKVIRQTSRSPGTRKAAFSDPFGGRRAVYVSL